MFAHSYFLHIKHFSDEIALTRQPLTCDDVITYLFASLSQEYDSLASTVFSRLNPIMLEEFYSLLLLYESCITYNNHPITHAVLVYLTAKQPLVHPSSQFRSSPVMYTRGRIPYRGRGRGV
jgi:hypothetical protein